MFGSAFWWIGDFFRIFGSHGFYVRPLCWIYEYAYNEHAAEGGGGGGQCDVNIPCLSRSKVVANDYRHSTGVDFEPNEQAADGVTAGQARHNSSNVGGVTAGHVGHDYSVIIIIDAVFGPCQL